MEMSWLFALALLRAGQDCDVQGQEKGKVVCFYTRGARRA